MVWDPDRYQDTLKKYNDGRRDDPSGNLSDKSVKAFCKNNKKCVWFICVGISTILKDELHPKYVIMLYKR